MLRHFNPDKTVSRKEKYAYTPNFWRNKPENHSNSSDVASKAKSDKEMYEKFDFYTHRKNEIFRIANTLLRYQKSQFMIDASLHQQEIYSLCFMQLIILVEKFY